MKRNTFGRKEHLKSEKTINELFEKGKSLYEHPIRLVYEITSSVEGPSIKAGFAVPKKKFKRSVDRNLLKRRMREAYRLNKQLFSGDNIEANPGLVMMFVFQGQKIENYQNISICINNLLKKLRVKMLKSQIAGQNTRIIS